MYLEDYYKRSPTAATYLGIHRYNDLLDDYSRQGVTDAVASARQFRERVAAIDAASLVARQPARPRTAAARHRLARADARDHPAVGPRPRQLQQRPDAHGLHHDQAQFRAGRDAAPPADRAREGDAGGAGRSEEESRESAAHLHGDRHRAAGRQPRVLRDGGGVGVSGCHRQGAAGRIQDGQRCRDRGAGRLQEVAAGRSPEAIERRLCASARTRSAGSSRPTR